MAESLSRRGVLGAGALVAGAIPGLVMGSSLPAASWRKVLGANDRIRIGVIGTGGQGTYHVDDFAKIQKAGKENIEITRVCDVYRKRLDRAVKLIGGGADSGTMEYERIIEDKNVDAVLIATPDHWHTKMAIEAMRANKAVYCEKPLSLTIEQAIECRNVQRETKVAFQVGPQGTSEDRWWKARDLIQKGRIGRLVWSQGAYCRNSREGQFNWAIDKAAGPSSPKESPNYIDWDRWLGHQWGLAPKIDYNADHFFRFRKYYAYNGGVATDLMFHRLAPLLIAANGPEGQYPYKVSASGGRFIENDGRDIGDTMLLTIDYRNPDHTVLLVSVMVNDVGVPDIVRGQYGQMEPDGDGWRLKGQGAWTAEFLKANADLLKEKSEEDMSKGVRISSEPRRNLKENWFDTIRGTSKAFCNIELGTAAMVAIKMGVESFRQNKTFLWDAKAEKVVQA